MQRIYIKTKLIQLFTLITLLMSSSSIIQAAELFVLDNQHTSVLWHIKHLGFSMQSGKWFADGTMHLDKANPQKSKVEVIIKIADMVTGIPQLDTHLKGKDFFYVDKFPTATFISNKVQMTGKETAKVEGILTLRGVSKPVTLNVTLNKEGVNPISNKLTAGFSAHAKIKRSDFGITAYLPALGDEVILDIQAEAKKYTQ